MRMIRLLTLLLIVSTIVGCSTATTEVIIPESEETKAPAPKKERPRLTECTTLGDLEKPLKGKTEDAFTLYRDQVKFKNFDQAKELWKRAYYTAPGANGRATYHFDDGIKIYDYLFSNATEESIKEGLVDTIFSIYDKRMSCFEDDGTILGRKAFDSYYKYSAYTDTDETFEMMKTVVDNKGKETDYFLVNPFSRMLYDRVLEEKISHAEASKYAYQIFEIIAYGKENCKDAYCEAWEVIEEYSPELLSGLEGIRGFYNCEYYMDKYYSQFEENPTDCDNVTEVYLKMVWANCNREDARFVALQEAKDKECYVAPPPPGPLKKASTALNEGNFDEAITFYNEYVTESDDAEKRANILLRIAKIYYVHKKNFPAARKFALQAAEQKDNWGDPYILIGKLYASSGPLCGPGRGWDSQIVTWPAIDKFQYAKNIDPTVAEEANSLISSYRKYMPKKEDIFLRQIKAGSSFRVPCWIQENTTVRTAD